MLKDDDCVVLRKFFNESDYRVLSKIGELQEKIMNLTGDTEGLISFKHNDTEIVNPFVDEISSCEVDPVAYYKDNFLKSGFMAYVGKI